MEHPALVEALVVCGAGTNEPHFFDPWTLDQQRCQLQAQQNGDVEGWVESYLTAYLAGPYRPLTSVDSALVKRCREMAGHTVEAHARSSAFLPEHAKNTWARLVEIDVPLLAIVGDLDSPDHRTMVRQLAAGVRGAKMVVREGAAHYPNMEQPDAFNSVLSGFLRNTEQRRSAASSMTNSSGDTVSKRAGRSPR